MALVLMALILMALVLMALVLMVVLGKRQIQQTTYGGVGVDCGGLEDAGAGTLVLENRAAVGLVDEPRGHVVPEHADPHG